MVALTFQPYAESENQNNLFLKPSENTSHSWRGLSWCNSEEQLQKQQLQRAVLTDRWGPFAEVKAKFFRFIFFSSSTTSLRQIQPARTSFLVSGLMFLM